jgi:hypothetical protein
VLSDVNGHTKDLGTIFKSRFDFSRSAFLMSFQVMLMLLVVGVAITQKESSFCVRRL